MDYGDYLADYSFKPIKEIKTTVKPVHEHIDKNLKFQEHVNMKENLQLKNVGKFRKKTLNINLLYYYVTFVQNVQFFSLDSHRSHNQDLSILHNKSKILSVINTIK